MDEVRFFPLGDSALTVEFGNSISIDLNRVSVALSDQIAREPFPGFIEAVPAYSSTSIFYNVVEVRGSNPEFADAYSAARAFTERVLEAITIPDESGTRLVEIPVSFDEEAGPDLEIVAKSSGLSAESVIKIFTGIEYRVFMLGFLPGFSYMGEVDDRIATPRKDTPRSRVARGSVGIAGKQTGIYSLESPGGWQIIGCTNIELFTPNASEPCFLKPGDRVRFIPVER